MNKNKIYSLDDPQNDSDAANKKYVDRENSKQDIAIADKASKSYVDNEIAKIPVPQNVLLLDGSKAMTGDLKMRAKNLIDLKNLTAHKVDDPLDYRIRDLSSAVNKEYLNTKFLKKDANDNDFDLLSDVIRNCKPYYDGLFGDNDLVSKAFVDAEIKVNYQNQKLMFYN